MRLLSALASLAFTIGLLLYGSVLWRALPAGSLLHCELLVVALGLALHLRAATR